MALCNDYFQRCQTTMDVHSKLRELLVCQYLLPKRESSRFRMLCKSEIPPAERSSVEDILNHLERTGKFSEGNYDFVKRKVQDIDVAIIYLIQEAERRIENIKANSLLVKAFVTEVDPSRLEKETREEVDLILLAVSEKLLCRSDEDAEIVCGLWERYQDLNTLSEDFLNIWHTKFCKCRKQHGRLLLLKFIKKGAHSLEQGETEFDRFKRTIAPTLLTTLQKSAIITLHVFDNCGASIVSVVRSSVSFYWVFDSVLNLDKLWRTYEEGSLHVELQDCFNAEEALHLLKVDRIKLKMTIQKSDYLKYRSILERKAPKDHRLASRLQTLYLDPVKSTKTTEGNPLVDSKKALKLHYAKRMETATETEYSKHFEKIKASLRDPLRDIEKKAPKYLASRLQIRDLDPVEYHVETTIITEGDPLIDRKEALKLDHAKRTDKTTKTEYSKHFEKIEESLKDPFSNPDIAQMKREVEAPYADSLTTRFNTDLTTERNPMKRKLYEVNKRLSESPTALSYIFKSHDMRPRELSYASVSLAGLNKSYGLKESDEVRAVSMTENILYERESLMMSADSMSMRSSYQSQETLMSKEAKSEFKEIPKKLPSGRKQTWYDRKVYETNDTKHSCVFILGEPGCGKTSYCLHLLRQWCKGEELQEFDYVFYVDSSILQCLGELISNLISYAVFGSYDSHKNDVDQILRNERCFILVDGGRYIKENYLSSQYSNCVFVFPMRPADFANSILGDISIHDGIIYQLKLDEKAMISLYNEIIIDKHESEISIPQRVKRQELSLQKKKTGSNTGLLATESDDFQGEGESDEKANLARNLSDYDQRFQKSSIAGATEETKLEQKIQERVSEYDRPELEFYKIKEVLEKVLDANYDSVMSIPMLGSICVELIAKGKDVPRNITSLSLCLVEKLVGQNEVIIEKGDKSVKSSSLFMSYKNIYRNVGALCKLGKVAYDSIFSTTPELLDFKILEECLQNREISLSMKTGLLVSLQALSDKVSDKPHVRFLHRSIQDTLVAMYIVTEKDQVFETFCQKLTSVDVIINMSNVIMMICGLIPHLGCRISKYINYVFDKDSTFSIHRKYQYTSDIVREMYKLQLSWFIEYKNALTPTRGDPKDTFYVSDIYIDEESDRETITKTATLMSDKNKIVMSLYTDDVSIESDLPDKVLNDFLAYNTSLRSICITGGRTCRTIEPLSLPSLTVLKLWRVNIQSASTDDEMTKPLLYNLPLLQSLHLDQIQLNGRILGVTSIKGKMPMLKKIDIYHVNMSDQSIALAPDMTVIENINLISVDMPPHGWMKFIKSLLNIHNSFEIRLHGSDIDSQSKEIVRTNKLFDIKIDERYVLIFRKLSL